MGISCRRKILIHEDYDKFNDICPRTRDPAVSGLFQSLVNGDESMMGLSSAPRHSGSTADKGCCYPARLHRDPIEVSAKRTRHTKIPRRDGNMKQRASLLPWCCWFVIMLQAAEKFGDQNITD